MRKLFQRLFCGILSVFLLAISGTPAVIAEENQKRVVRVGYYITPGFQEYDESKDTYSGYSYEYLLALAQYANWDYELIPVSFSEGVTMLENGELDLMNNVSRTTEREEVLSFSDSASGSNCAYLAVDPNNTNIAYEDFSAFDHLRVGLVTTSIYSEKFLAYAKANEFEPQVTWFDTKEDAIAALESGKIEARVITSSQNIDMHIVAKFAPEPFYFAVPKENTELLKELNQAMSTLKTNDPDFEVRLEKKYYSNVADDNTVLTESEKQFIVDHPVVKVAYDESCYPLSYTDSDGNFAGAIADFYSIISERTGLKFEFIGTSATGLKESTELNEIEVYSNLAYNYVWAETFGLKLTPPFADITVMEARRTNSSQTGGVMAVVDGYYLDSTVRSIYGDQYTYAVYSDTKSCIDAVKNGKADVTVLTSYESEYYQSSSKYRSLVFSVSKPLDYSMSIGIAHDADPAIFSILMKGLNAISDNEKESIFRTTSLEAQRPDSLSMLLNHPEIAIPSLIIIAILAGFLFYSVLHFRSIRKKNELIERQNQQLRDAVASADRANTAKSQFLSRMSHEIRTPMNAIVGLTTIARTHLNEPDKMTDYLAKIDTSSKVLLNIINDVLDMSSIESGKMKIAHEDFDIKSILTGISTIYYPQCESKGIAFAMESNLEHEMYTGDSLRINQVLMNLVSNAYKFTGAGGSIRISVQETACRKQTAFIRFIVADTGIGMNEEMKNRLFKPFEQENASTAKKHGGSGLGLSIAKNLVDLMHGAIKVDSVKGEGTTFTVDLPIEISKNSLPIEPHSLEALRILVIDDDLSAREYAGIVLQRIGTSYESASSGEEALKMIEAANQEGRPYDVCLIDWKMPNMDGIEVTKRIRSLEKQRTIIIIVSAYDVNEVVDTATRAGADHFVSKPLFQSTLFNVLNQLTQGKIKKETAEPDEYNFEGHTLLLAEDNDLNAEIATDLLEMVNMKVVRAEDGEKALHLFEVSQPGEFCMILMDVQMPVMDGYEATKAIRQLDREDAKTITIYAMTANAFTEDVSEALSAGMNGHIAKPIDTEVLYHKIQETLRKQKN